MQDITDTEDHRGCVCSDNFEGDYRKINLKTVLKVIVKDTMWLYMPVFLVTTLSFATLLLYKHPPRGGQMASVPMVEDED
mmetsp:Transcript_30191/g.35890  ORF Transcript_30191/g.35890 Transcript_30191/m.35890 type:complete len:80 (-) Transcript_30191:762-1001(-)